MIPWFNIQFPTFHVPIFGWPLTIHAFGILVATGILVGAWLTRKRGRELGLVDENVAAMITTTLVVGFIVAHIFDLYAYRPNGYWPSWREVLNPTMGFSSFGGFLGAVGGLVYWCKSNKQPIMPYADALGYGLATGWMFGRLGCFSAHDHPGIHTTFFLAVKYPDGPRFDLGLLEALWAAGMALSFAILRRKRRPLGTYVSILVTAYAPVRFGLDFLRVSGTYASDRRYGGLTPAQWGCFVALAAGIALSIWTVRHAKAKTANTAS